VPAKSPPAPISSAPAQVSLHGGHPSSVVPSQSSSHRVAHDVLHSSVVPQQAPQVQSVAQVRFPLTLHALAQVPLVPWTQSKPSSVDPSQSSSRPEQVSDGGAQGPHAQSAPQGCVPEEPQEVMQPRVSPRTQV
jgi:hypothetical protein